MLTATAWVLFITTAVAAFIVSRETWRRYGALAGRNIAALRVCEDTREVRFSMVTARRAPGNDRAPIRRTAYRPALARGQVRVIAARRAAA